MIQYADKELHEQGSFDWQRQRLGNITGSQCGDLMVKGRAKDEVFGSTAKTYLYKLAAERNMNEDIVNNDAEFGKYLEEEVNINSKPIRLGHEREPEARRLFEKFFNHQVFEVVSCPHDEIEHFAASPDGVVVGSDGRPTACIEIKSTGMTNFMKYKTEVKDAEGLKKANPTYYWQTQAEMMCTGLNMTYFIVFSPFQKIPLHVVEIQRNDDDCALLAERIRLANEFIDNLLNNG